MAEAGLDIKVERVGSTSIVSAFGEVDLTASPALRAALKEVQASRPQRVVVDLGGVPYMDSSGVATLVEAMQITRRTNTQLVLCSLQDRVRSIFEIARLDTVFKILPSRDAAMAP